MGDINALNLDIHAPSGFSNLVDVCRWRGRIQRDDIAYTFLMDGETDERSLTFGELDWAARNVAAHVLRHARQGDRALLLYEPGLDYLIGFYGCLYAGLIPAPAYPPNPMRMDRTLPRLRAILDDCQASVILGEQSGLGWANSILANLSSARVVIATDQLEEDISHQCQPHRPNGADLAFLQYTSGSTGSPRGVMVSHSNIIYQTSQLAKYDVEDGVGVTWLPMYHDLGLIGGVMFPMYVGRHAVSMSPLSFVQRPLRWLQAIDRYRACTTAGPNFAYELCVRKVNMDECQDLDLTCWRYALNGAEPIRPKTLETFLEKFAPLGVSSKIFYPCYGLAEATLGVSSFKTEDVEAGVQMVRGFSANNLEKNLATESAPEDSDTRVLVSCGPPLDETHTVIVDPHTCRRLPDGQVGEIWVQSPGVAQGYWNRPQSTEHTFAAYIEGLYPQRRDGAHTPIDGNGHSKKHRRQLLAEVEARANGNGQLTPSRNQRENRRQLPSEGAPTENRCTGESNTSLGRLNLPNGWAGDQSNAAGPYMRTGDLGFIYNHELFITGRLKELMILGGRNYYPQDIEKTVASCHPGLKIDGGAAFSIDVEGQERLVVVHEIVRPRKYDLEEVFAGIRESLLVEHETTPYAIVLIKAATLSKTTSGKIQRRETREDYLRKALNEVARWQADSEGAEKSTVPREMVPPRTSTEEQVAQMWKEVLDLPEVSVLDNFFELGGQSLLAMQLAARIRENFGVEVPVGRVFRDPTIANLASIIDEFQQHAVQSDATSDRRFLPTAKASPIPQIRRNEPAPLSFSQERLWFLDQLAPGNSAYNIFAAIRLSGPLDPCRLEFAFGELAKRHETLRTTFSSAGGRPVQHIASAAAVQLAQTDLGSFPLSEQEGELRRRASCEIGRPFDLAQGPLFRAHLYRESDVSHVVLVVMHHLIADGWSMGVLVRELTALYQKPSSQNTLSDSNAGSQTPPLKPLPLQFADYAAWQQQRSDREDERHLKYWEEKLAGAPSSLELPTDRPRGAQQTFAGRRHVFDLSPELGQAIDKLGRRLGATPFMTLLAAFQSLLSRYSRQHDICVGVPVAGRTRTELEGLIGFFVNTLVMRAELSGDPTFAELVEQTRDNAFAAFEHQEAPFEKVVARLGHRQDAGMSPLFQVMFVLQNAPLPDLDFPELKAEIVDLDAPGAAFDLTLEMRESSAGGYRGSLQYNTDLFDASTIERLAAHFEKLLTSLVNDPQQPVAAASLLPESERRQILEDFNSVAKPEFLDRRTPCVPQLVEQQARQAPEAIAVVDGDTALDYRDLNERANQIAHYLLEQGVGRETIVGVCMERSIDLVASMLGILKAGGAFLPLDPNYPQQRLEYLLQDSSVEFVLTHEKTRKRLSQSSLSDPTSRLEKSDELAATHFATGPTFLLLDRDAEIISKKSRKNPGLVARSSDLAYVIYTSGSTGRPKGVQVEHGGWRNTALSFIDAMSLSPTSRVLQFASPSFDASMVEISMTLGCGAALHLYAKNANLYETLKSQRISAAILPPSSLAILPCENLSHLQTIMSAGEACTRELVGRWAPGRTFINGYGPTEATVCSSMAVCNAEDLRRPPIGQPMANTLAYVLDKAMQPTPIGVPGELYIGGAGVARGYIGRPQLTAERFLENPFTPPFNNGPDRNGQSNDRLYKTGDLVRWRADGQLEFLGRLDNQVKLRGYRIELGEVEAAVLQHPRVAQAVAMVREDRAGDRRLVLYVTKQPPARENGQPVSPASLHRYLFNKLPAYMQPSSIMVMETFPLTPNGKIDQQGLPAPDGVRPELQNEYVAPRGELETKLASIWAEVLHVDRVGTTDSFFDLGGNSLLAMQVAARITNTFGVTVPLHSLFEEPTIARLAHCIGLIESPPGRRPAGKEALASIPVVSHDSRPDKLPLTFTQERLWFLDQLEPESPLYNTPGAFRLSGELDISALRKALGEMVRRHQILRTVFPSQNGRPAQKILDPSPVDLPLLDLTLDSATLDKEQREKKLQRLLQQEASKAFDLTGGVEGGPLLRATLIRLAPLEHVFAINMHHIISDGWSVGVFASEMAVLYEAFRQRRPSPLPEPALQYADYTLWHRGEAQSEEREQHLSWWKEQLANLPPTLALPTDRPRPANGSHHGATLRFELSAEVAESVQRISRDNQATPFMTLLCVWQALLSRYSGQQDLAVGAPISGRNRVELEGLLGFFVNTLVLRGDLSGDPTLEELLDRTRQTTLDAYARQETPFEQLVETLQIPRDLTQNPLFQVMFSMDVAPLPNAQASGISIRPYEMDYGLAKFDLTLTMSKLPKDQGSEMLGALEFNTDLFDHKTARRLINHFEQLVQVWTQHPQRRLSEISLLSEVEQNVLIRQWSGAEQATASNSASIDLTLDRFEAQAKKTPQAVALECDGVKLTYQELNAKANQLARRLRAFGVGREIVVGVCLERSPELIVGLLAVMKAGGAYLPLDPQCPAGRLQWMIEDAGAHIAITNRRLRGLLPENELQSVLVDPIQPDSAEIAACKTDNLLHRAAPEDLAYIIYTSGSTGRPKGVEITHGSLANFVAGAVETFDMQADDRVLQFASICFDTAVEEIFTTLTCGASLVLRNEQMLSSPAVFLEQCRQWNISVLDLPTAYWHQIVAADAPEKMLAQLGQWLRLVIIGGEAALPRRLADWRREVGDSVGLINTYGPTETTVVATAWEADEEDEGANFSASAHVKIGRPLLNVEVYVFEENGQPAPIGVPGELVIGGLGLARGYRNLPQLTAEKFVKRSIAGGDSKRFYRTGDMVRWTAGGQLEFIGRRDDQVKIRGYRIELGEIETVLVSHTDIEQAVVVVDEDEHGEKRLAAFVTSRSDQPEALSLSTIREHLQNQLPHYMIPAVWTRLDSMPTSPQGKIDRLALPRPNGAVSQLAAEYVPPQTELEQLLALEWREVLGVECVGIHDNFFDLGGHSLKAAELISRLAEPLSERMAGPLPLRRLFEAPTIAELAAAIENQKLEATSGPLLPLRRSGNQRPLYCVHPAGGSATCYARLAKELGPDQPFIGIQTDVTGQTRSPSIEEMAADYVAAIVKEQPQGPYQLAGWSLGALVAFEMARQLTAAGRIVTTLALIDPPSDIDELNGPSCEVWDELGDANEESSHVSTSAHLQELARLLGYEDFLTPQALDDNELAAEIAADPFTALRKMLTEGQLDLPPALLPDREKSLDLVQQHIDAASRYTPVCYSGPLHLVLAEKRRDLDAAVAAWSARTSKSFHLHITPGTHLSMVMDEHDVQYLAAKLRKWMANPS